MFVTTSLWSSSGGSYVVCVYKKAEAPYRSFGLFHFSSSSRRLLVVFSSSSRRLLVDFSSTSRRLLVDFSSTSRRLLVDFSSTSRRQRRE
ncbi:MAG: hypothetical protein GY822_05005 [Deltaproteobacteria bacterium]|nr:hypothetical protein [Deltaproteobacteria bacterium]